ncbi:MAG: glucose-6-phosphate isomerase [Clostridiales bacterium]|nr:glucose-6-phosphate isomerase [Clostridiales bacterium]
MIKTDISALLPFIPEGIEPWLEKAGEAASRLKDEKAFAGWLHLPSGTSRELLDAVNAAAAKIRGESQILLVIGIGGSYLGARAALELLRPTFGRDGEPEVIFAGNNLSGQYAAELLAYLEDKDFSINVISKSGTTTEPAVAFRIFYRLLEKKYGEGAPGRVYATTDANRGALRMMAEKAGFTRFVIPDDVGGRYSVLTPVGLLPIAAAGIDINAMMDGAKAAEAEYLRNSADNSARLYAAARQALYAKGKKVETLSFWEPRFRFLGEWWKQLFGESEGKEGLGIFPASLELTADLHSMGQYMQQGERMLFETMLYSAPSKTVAIPFDEANSDGLNYISGRDIDYVNRTALEATARAHADGGVPCIRLDMPAVTAASVGNLFYFFEVSCAISAYISGVYPFDQPGVEAYKKNMFAMLGKK